MKNLIVLSLIGILLAACSSQSTIDASGFPLEKGTTRVYSYQTYAPSPSDPTQIIKATYELTETVVDTETISNYFVAHVQRNRKLINADPDWTQEVSGEPNEFWYVRDDQQIFHSKYGKIGACFRIAALIQKELQGAILSGGGKSPIMVVTRSRLGRLRTVTT
jgi:hypothetical protein